MRTLGRYLGAACGAKGASWTDLGRLSASWGPLRVFWGVLEASWAFLGRLGGVLGASWGRLGASWGLIGASWGRLEASLERLGGVLGASWAVLGASWGCLGSVLDFFDACHFGSHFSLVFGAVVVCDTACHTTTDPQKPNSRAFPRQTPSKCGRVCPMAGAQGPPIRILKRFS